MATKFVNALGLGATLAASLVIAHGALAKDWKTVVIGMEGAYEPWNLTDSSGKIVGFEPDLVTDLCKRAGVECKIIAQDWDGMIPGLKAGKFDVIMDGMSITDERKKEIDFSKPYAASPGAFLAPKDSPLAKAPGRRQARQSRQGPSRGDAAIKAVQAALKGKTLGVQVSTTHANFASQYLKDVATVKEYKTTDDRDLDLKSGRIDASLDDFQPSWRRQPPSLTPRTSPSSGRNSSAACSASARAWASARATRTSPPNSIRRLRRRSPTGRSRNSPSSGSKST